MFSASYTIDAFPLVDALTRLPAALDATKAPMREAMAESSSLLMAFELRDFIAKSGEGGGWAPLAFATKRSRLYKERKAAGSKTRLTRAIIAAAILPIEFVTGTMQAGLFTVGGSGHFQKFDANSVSEGVDGGSHPGGKLSVGRLAAIQHYGNARLPARPLMVAPQGSELELVIAPLRGGVGAAMAMAGGGYGQASAGG